MTKPRQALTLARAEPRTHVQAQILVMSKVFNGANVVKQLIWTRMTFDRFSAVQLPPTTICRLPRDFQLLHIIMHAGQSRRSLKWVIQPSRQIAIEE